jgi:hypothetical protein
MNFPVRLDYQRPSRPFPWAGTALFVMALTALALIGGYYYDITQKTERLEAGARQIARASFKTMWPDHRDVRETDLEIQHANDLLQQISLPWEKLFQAVESSAGMDVTLLGLEPDMDKHVVKITGEARNFYVMLSYLQRLEERKEFSSVYLQNHRVRQQDPDKPVRFAVLATWRNSP